MPLMKTEYEKDRTTEMSALPLKCTSSSLVEERVEDKAKVRTLSADTVTVF